MHICHYLYCLLIVLGLGLTNKYALIYFIIVIIYNTYLINFSICIFYILKWTNPNIQNISTKIFFPLLLTLYILKYSYVSRFAFSIS